MKIKKEIKKIIFVNPFPYYAAGINEATIYAPLGLAYIAAYLREYLKVECLIIDANVLELTNDKVIEEIDRQKPDMVFISANIVTARSGSEISKIIKEKYNGSILVAFGGPYPTALPEKLINESSADFVIKAEGEKSSFDLINALNKGQDISNIGGLCYREQSTNKIIINKPAELIQDLDSLPFPAYDLLPNFKLYKGRSRGTPVAPVMTSRGCPYGCTFCNRNIFGRTFRARSPENVVNEIEFLIKNFGVRQIDILDDNFTMDIDRADKICDLIIQRGLKVYINCANGIRADRLTEELVIKMKKAGVFKVGMGIESADDQIRKNIQKSLDINRVMESTKWFKKHGVIVYGFFMLGLPGETEETLRKTIDFAKELDPHIANFSLTTPFPGSELWEQIEKEGKFTKDLTNGSDSGYYENKFSFELGNINGDLVLEYQQKAYKEFYMRPRKILQLIASARSYYELKWIVDAAIPLLKVVK